MMTKIANLFNDLRATGQGVSEGVNSVVAAVPDALLYVASIPARAAVKALPPGPFNAVRRALTPDMERGVLSGAWVKTRLDEYSRNKNGYDVSRETESMRDTREVSATTTEVAGTAALIVTTAGLGSAVATTRTAAIGTVVVSRLSDAGNVLHGVELGFDEAARQAEAQAAAAAPAPVP